MQATITTFQLAGGFWGYLVEAKEAGVRLRQTFAPGVPGIVRMSQAEAQAYAEQEVAALQEAMAAAAAAAEAGQGEAQAPTES